MKLNSIYPALKEYTKSAKKNTMKKKLEINHFVPFENRNNIDPSKLYKFDTFINEKEHTRHKNSIHSSPIINVNNPNKSLKKTRKDLINDNVRRTCNANNVSQISAHSSTPRNSEQGSRFSGKSNAAGNITYIYHVETPTENRYPLRGSGTKTRLVRKEDVLCVYEVQVLTPTTVDMLNIRGDRLNTFLFRWKQIQGVAWPGQLADAGFFYEGSAFDVQCFECRIVTSVDKWPRNENPTQAHARLNPKCPFVIQEGFKPVPTFGGGKSLEQNNYVAGDNVVVRDTHLHQNIAVETLKQTQPSDEHRVPVLTRSSCHSSFLTNGYNTSASTESNMNEIKTAPSRQPRAQLDICKDGLSIGDNISTSVGINEQIQTLTDSMNSQLTMDVSSTGYLNIEVKYPQYQSASSRLRSFETWRFSQKQTPQSLSLAGYFYTGENDIVRCFCCDLGLAEWDPKDDPWTEHARHNPKCCFLIKEKGTLFIEFIQKDWKKIYNPKHAAFDDKESRIATFDDWRKDIEQTPEMLADAGFFYTGEEDVVRCHYCDGGLRHWEPGDIPWEEHARWFPFCKFLIKMKGREYIEETKRKTEERQLSESTASTAFNLPASSIVQKETEEEKDPKKIKEINRQLKDKMKCIRCRNNEICMLFVNCGHRQTCEECADLMDFCPICDTRIKKRLKTFLS